MNISLLLGIDPEFPPYTYLDEDYNSTGFDVDICKAACERMGWNFGYYSVNWDLKYEQLYAGKCDCIWSALCIPNQEIKGYYFSEPYYDLKQVFITNDSNLIAVESFNNKKVAVLCGSTAHTAIMNDEIAENFNEVIICSSVGECFNKLDNDNADAILTDDYAANEYLNSKKNKSEYAVIETSYCEEKYGIAFRSEDNEIYTALINAIHELVNDGTYKLIADKYPDICKYNLVYLK